MPSVTSVNISTAKGTRKSEVPLIRLVRDHGIEGDAHAGNWHRQISMLAEESVDTMRAACSHTSAFNAIEILPCAERPRSFAVG